MTDKLEQEPVALSRGAKKEIIDTYIKLHEGKIGMHWLWAAILRIVNGESEPDVMDDFGYQFMPTEKAVETAALIRAVEALEANEQFYARDTIQSLITENGMRALRELVTKAVTEAVNEYSDYHYEGNEPDISNTVDRVLESK